MRKISLILGILLSAATLHAQDVYRIEQYSTEGDLTITNNTVDSFVESVMVYRIGAPGGTSEVVIVNGPASNVLFSVSNGSTLLSAYWNSDGGAIPFRRGDKLYYSSYNSSVIAFITITTRRVQ